MQNESFDRSFSEIEARLKIAKPVALFSERTTIQMNLNDELEKV